ncbi:PLP-dependent aminotransferase family protein [Streptomyces erythrochromogenes]|uniref:aminotransferase-like domain-containing protein n=1 Tax=Streptomyces erythrochromogenes TaxID=285574 RepID=UPI0038637636|nr:PLP-dependent aminotransferase family protein [Streptomyces erythrochromogenes]
MTSVSEDFGSAPVDLAEALPGVRLDAADLHASVRDPALTSMTLLNEIASRFPEAVSFAAGRPYEGFYEVAGLHSRLRTFERHLVTDLGLGPEDVRRTFFQYGRTKGFIHHLITRHLENDERMAVDPESVVVTTGCQEAMVLVLRALRRDDRDVILTAYPSYVGFLGATRLVDMPVRPVAEGPGGIDLADLAEQIRRARAEGLRPRACYVVPDFANPSGVSMSQADRGRLLELAEREDVLILEDNPYSMFHAGGSGRLPTLKSMDTGRRVVYFGSFAKTAFAGARVGYVVADQPMADGGLFADELAKLKSMLTLNTSTVAQAVVGGFLLENDCSVERATVREAQVYRENLRAVVTGLRERFGDHGPVPGSGVSWNAPAGGMFVVVTLPFRADDAMLEYSADRFGVLWTPMHHFYAGDGGSHQIRLSFSVLSAERIGLGLDRLAALVADRA